MKKFLFLAVAAVAMLATSCSKDETANAYPEGDTKVSFTVVAPELQTRTIGDGTTATTLEYAVYDANWNHIAYLDGTTTINLQTTVDLELIDGKTYNLIFWAENAASPYDFNRADKKVYVNYDNNFVANNEKYDAFYAPVENLQVRAGLNPTVRLYRPFAQLNVATSDWDHIVNSNEAFENTEVEVKAYNTLNLVDGEVSGDDIRTFNFAAMPTETLSVNGQDYKWLAMNYLLVNEKELVEVTFNAQNNNVAEKKWYNVPVERNHRTHILGKLLTSSVDFEVIIMPDFIEPAEEYVDGVETLLTAIADATNGETITVAPGTYPVVLDITGAKNFTLKAAGEVVFAGVAHETNGSNSQVIFDGITIDNSIIATRAEGGWFTGTAPNIAPCVGAWGGDLTFNNCKFIVAGTSGRETGVMTWWTGNNQMSLAFNGCEFVGKDNHASARAMQIYGKVDMEVNNCTFTTAKDYTLKYVAQEGNVAVFEGNTVSNSENFVELGSSAYPGNKYTVKINNNTLNSVNPYVVANKENQTIYVNNQVVEIVADAVANVASQSDLANALNNADETKTTVINVAAGEYTMPSGLNENVTLNCAEGTVFKGNSKLNINGATVVGATFSNPSGSAVDQTINGTFKGCEFEGSNAVRYAYAGETVVFEDCVFSGNVYGIHFDGGKNDVIFRNCTISGFNALGADLTMVTFEGCTFVGNGKSGYNGANLWGSAKMINCEFTFNGTTSNEWIDCIGADKTYEFVNCTVNGVAYTADNYAEYGDIFSRNHVVVKINGVECQM